MCTLVFVGCDSFNFVRVRETRPEMNRLELELELELNLANTLIQHYKTYDTTKYSSVFFPVQCHHQQKKIYCFTLC